MNTTAATCSDLDEAVQVLVAAFAKDPITGFLLQTGPDYPERLTRFFTLLMRARIALAMPVILARNPDGIKGAVMGYTTARPVWPKDLAEEWNQFEKSIPGLENRLALYEEVAAAFMPPTPHYYLGVIGVDPAMRGRGVGKQLLAAFCDLSVCDHLSDGVYLETAQPSNVQFYESAGFGETGCGSLGAKPLWCMFLHHSSRGLS